VPGRGPASELSGHRAPARAGRRWPPRASSGSTTPRTSLRDTIQRVLGISPAVRYVAIYHGGEIASAARPDLTGAGSSESDKSEELLVNPTLLTLTRPRGIIDCGGLEFLLIRYGSYFVVVVPLDQRHVTAGIELSADPLPLVPRISDAVSSLRSAKGVV
jgi:hypothetical protein